MIFELAILESAWNAAAPETLRLVPSRTSRTGFKGVRLQDGKFVARIAEAGKMRYLGIFPTALDAAACYAREIGEERAAAEAAEGNVVVVQPPLTANVMDEVDNQEEKTTLKAICFKPATNPRRWALDRGSTECDGRSRRQGSAAAHGNFVPMGNRALARD